MFFYISAPALSLCLSLAVSLAELLLLLLCFKKESMFIHLQMMGRSDIDTVRVVKSLKSVSATGIEALER